MKFLSIRLNVNVMGELTDEICREKVEWVRRRLEALDKMEVKLREMKALATYAASRSLTEQEVALVQEWVDILQAEVIAIDKATAWMGGNSLSH